MKKKLIVKKSRLIFIIFMISMLFIVLTFRIGYIMLLDKKDLGALATNQWKKSIEIAPLRGKIMDRNGSTLAISVSVYRIDADLSVLKTYLQSKSISEADAVSKLSPILNMDSQQLQKILDSTDKNGDPLQFVSIKRKVTKDTADAIKALKYIGVIISDDTERIYPNGNFLSNVIGHTNFSGVGITGVEDSYNKILSGTSGIKVVETDKDDNELPYTESVTVNPINGKDITLTIDEKIQQLAESVAKETLQDDKAQSVSITIMNPSNGEILGMVTTPGYDLNNPNSAGKNSNETQEIWKNKSVSNMFEPGSIFKVMTAAAALQNNVVNDSDKFRCSGSINVAGTTLYSDEKTDQGWETFSDIIKNSDNVGFIQVGQRLGKDKFLSFATQAGFGQKTGIDLPGEGAGILRSSKDTGPVELATLSYGQGVAVTQVQYMAAFNAVANGGTWIRPHVMKETSHVDNGKTVVDKEYDNLGKKTIMDSDKAAQLRQYLIRVVKEGTATATYMEGYSIAGKTGTANKIDPTTGKYEEGKYMASFAGMYPAENPQITLIVTVDEPDPQKYYAAETAVPAAKKLFQGLFSIMNASPDNSK